MNPKRWIAAECDEAEAGRLAAAAGLSPLTARLLIHRGVRDAAQARSFLRPDLNALAPPAKFPDMKRTVSRLRKALRGNEPIAVFGDYDVDGTCGTALLVRFLRLLGREVPAYIPHRVDEGYGLNREAIERFAADGVRLLIAVDCGTSNVEEISFARERGMDVIVLDHHEPPPELPPAYSMINPKQKEAEYPFAGLCSAAVSFKVIWALSEGMNASSTLGQAYKDFIFDALGYVALGTLADVCPLLDENRVLVLFGLQALQRTSSRGLRTLMAKARLTGKKLDSWDVAFRIAPRLNALGRIGKSHETLDLLVSESQERVDEIVDRMESANNERRAIEGEISKQAMAQVRSQVDLDSDRVIVVADSRWHPGVVGITAARLVDAFHRPAFVLAIQDDFAHGSARSIEGFPLHEAMESCKNLLTTHGGHAMAAGVGLDRKNLGAFRRALNDYASRNISEEEMTPSLRVDGEAPLAALTQPVVREVEMLAPHGTGNPPPVFTASDVRIVGEPKLMGKRSDHVSFHVAQGGPGIRAVGFGFGAAYDDLCSAKKCSLAFTPSINSFAGRETVELKVKDIHF